MRRTFDFVIEPIYLSCSAGYEIFYDIIVGNVYGFVLKVDVSCGDVIFQYLHNFFDDFANVDDFVFS